MTENVWDQTTIARVKDIYSELHVDNEFLVMATDSDRQGLSLELFRTLQSTIRIMMTLQLFLNDCELFSQEDPLRDQRILKMRWHPSTRAVELRGGPGDGRVVEHTDLNKDIITPSMTRVPIGRPVPVQPETPVYDLTHYSLLGWGETSRQWIFTPGGK